MTCIIGIEDSKNSRVYIGGDLQGTGGNCKVIHTQPKVVDVQGLVFGYSGSYRTGQVIEHNLHEIVLPEKSDIYRWLVQKLVPQVRQVIKNVEAEKPSLLLGIHDELWEIQPDYSVLRSVKGYNVIGSGRDYALGAIDILLAQNQNPVKCITKAMETVHEWCPSVGQDVHIQYSEAR